MKTPIGAVAIGAFSLFLTACGSASPDDPETRVDSTRATLVTENMLTALDERDYAEFSREFRPELKEALSEPNFVELEQRLRSTAGEWVSVGEPSSVPAGPSYVEYRMTATFERDFVDVWIWFEPPNDLVLGVWFDSPALREP